MRSFKQALAKCFSELGSEGGIAVAVSPSIRSGYVLYYIAARQAAGGSGGGGRRRGIGGGGLFTF